MPYLMSVIVSGLHLCHRRSLGTRGDLPLRLICIVRIWAAERGDAALEQGRCDVTVSPCLGAPQRLLAKELWLPSESSPRLRTRGEQ